MLPIPHHCPLSAAEHGSLLGGPTLPFLFRQRAWAKSTSRQAPQAGRIFRDSQSDFGDVNMSLIWFQGGMFMWYVNLGSSDFNAMCLLVLWFSICLFTMMNLPGCCYLRTRNAVGPNPRDGAFQILLLSLQRAIQRVDRNRYQQMSQWTERIYNWIGIIIIIKLGFMSIYVWGILDMDPNFGKRKWDPWMHQFRSFMVGFSRNQHLNYPHCQITIASLNKLTSSVAFGVNFPYIII